MRERDGKKLSRTLQVPIQEQEGCTSTGLQPAYAGGAKNKGIQGKNDRFTFINDGRPAPLRPGTAAKKHCGKLHRHSKHFFGREREQS